MKYLDKSSVGKNDIKIGLNNIECLNPQFYCKSHNVYLSQADAEKKGCFKKLSADMMEERLCKSLTPIDVYEQELIRHKENIQKIKESRKNDGLGYKYY